MNLQLIEENHGTEFRLGRHVEHDERSLAYANDVSLVSKLKTVVQAKVAKPVLWPRYSPILDQGQLGSCTGNASTGFLGTAPFSSDAASAAKFDEAFAVDVYKRATVIDGFPGEYPPTDTGSSGLAVAKVLQSLGYIKSYGHATTTAGLIAAIQKSPVIVGVAWYKSFFTPDATGQIHVGGAVVGGHEFLIRGYDPSRKLFFADNSWGSSWNKVLNGSFTFDVATWEALRKQQADVTILR